MLVVMLDATFQLIQINRLNLLLHRTSWILIRKFDAISYKTNLHRLLKDTVAKPVSLPIIDPIPLVLLAVL
jgi:hypothetical protein